MSYEIKPIPPTATLINPTSQYPAAEGALPPYLVPVESNEILTWDVIRVKRQKLIADTDWAVLPDAPVTEALRTDILAYRQTLRDITKAFASPELVVWPKSPIEIDNLLKQFGITQGGVSIATPEQIRAERELALTHEARALASMGVTKKTP